jgi:hypothetical protein
MENQRSSVKVDIIAPFAASAENNQRHPPSFRPGSMTGPGSAGGAARNAGAAGKTANSNVKNRRKFFRVMGNIGKVFIEQKETKGTKRAFSHRKGATLFLIHKRAL